MFYTVCLRGDNEMKININVKRKYKIQGKEYNSLDEMPDDIRAAFEKTAGSPSPSGLHRDSDATRTKIVLNGREYENIEAMPQDIRELYEQVLKAAETGTAPSESLLKELSTDMIGKTRTPDAVRAGDIRQAPKFESSFSFRSLIVTGLLAAFILLLFYLFYK